MMTGTYHSHDVLHDVHFLPNSVAGLSRGFFLRVLRSLKPAFFDQVFICSGMGRNIAIMMLIDITVTKTSDIMIMNCQP